MNDFFAKQQYTEQDILLLIENHVEESVYLDFKAAGSLVATEDKKKEIAKDVSAFANSDGGIIVYGITEANHQAGSLSYIDGNAITKEWLEQVIQSRVSPRLNMPLVYPVRFDNDISQSVYVVKIPRSVHAPHMTADKKFYKRYNFQSVQMEEFEIRDLYNRKDRTDLIIDELLIVSNGATEQAGQLRMAGYQVRFQVKNDSQTIENQYKLEIAVPLVIMTVLNPINQYKIRNEGEYVIFSVPNLSPLFQDELTTVAEISLHFHLHTLSYLQKPIKTKLYFSSGTRSKEYLLQGRLLHKAKTIEESDWTN
jgi:hypothetical protein